jgi:tetratricopeptide (TPR) repeat protein
MKYWTLLALVFLLSGCASTLNQRNAHEYANAGQSAQLSGNWDAARRYWAKAVVNARLGGMTDKQLAIAYYEYGRSLGATCFFDESEKYLKEAFELDSKNGGPVHMALLELGRLNLDQKKYQAATSYYEQLPSIYEALDAASKVPAGVAETYSEYSTALSASGNKSKANQFNFLAQKLASEATSPSTTERTPYGKHCK